MTKKLEELNEILDEYYAPKKLKKYILGETNLVFTEDFYDWKYTIKDIVKLLGVENEYTIRAIKALFDSDEYDKVEIFFNNFEKNSKFQKKAIEYLIERIDLTISNALRYYFQSFSKLDEDEQQEIDNKDIFTYFYKLDKDEVESIILEFNGYDSSTGSGGFSYYGNSGINSYLSMMIHLNTPSFEKKIREKIDKLDYNSNFILYLSLIKDESDIKDILSDKILNYLNGVGATQDLKDAIDKYILTGKKDKKFDKLIKKINTENRSYIPYGQGFTTFIKYIKPNPEDKYYQRLIYISMKIDKYRTIKRLLFTIYTKKFTYKLDLYDFNQIISEWEAIEFEDIIDYLTYHIAIDYYGLDAKKFLLEYLKVDSNEVFNALSKSSGKGIEASLDIFYKFDKEKTYNFVVDNIAIFSGKRLIEKVVTILSEKRDLKLLQKLAIHKKSKVREIAVTSLIKINDSSNINFLTDILKKEKSKAIQNIIMEYLSQSGLKKKLPKDEDGEEFTQFWFMKKAEKTRIKFPYWLLFKDLPKLHWLDSKKELTEKEVNYFISLASSNKKVIPSEVLRKFGALLIQDELKEFSRKIYQLWNEEAKTKWALSFSAAFGDDSFIAPLKEKILTFVSYGRGAMASQMVEAIAMIGTRKAFQTVDWFSKKVRHKQVKNASIAALETAAKELNISKEELLDKIIPNFGFDKDGKINLDYGARNFDIKLNPDLTFLITDNKGKKFKNLPKPGKNDDSEIATKSSKFFKELKKEVKNQVKLQKNRLENGFSANRLWNFASWSELFINNPMMKQFALTLLWGNYNQQGELIKAFRFLEDGSFINLEEDEITLKDDEKIGLVHPIELTQERLDEWIEQLDDYEIVQPFSQLSRAIYRVKDADKDKLSLDDFMGYLIGRTSLKGKLFNKGWSRGSVQDAGCFYEYYKEFEFYGIGVELNFEGDCVGGYDEYGDIPIKEITFYVANSVQRGSYVYDKPAKDNTFSLGQLPQRLYSEIYHEIKTIAESGKGFDPEWEKKDWW